MARFNPFSIFKRKSLEEKIEDIIEKRNSSAIQNQIEEVGQTTKDAKSLSIANILKTLKSKVLVAFKGGIRGVFQSPEWDFKKAQLAFTNESIFRRSVEKYTEQIRKHDWEFIGNNPNTVKYIRKRFEQIATVSNKPTSDLFDELAYNIVLYNNIVISKQRNRKASGGKERTTFDGYNRVPVAGYSIIDPSTVEVDRDDYGNVRKWRQVRKQKPHNYLLKQEDDLTIEWPTHNIIHIKDRSASSGLYFFSMPMSVPVIADMQALRELEELVLLESIKVAVPKLHAKVGSKDQPGTQEQVNDLASTIRNITGDGILITTERITLDDVAKATTANNILTSSIAYFRARVLAGLGMSDVAMGAGDTANRATAQVMSSEIQSTSAKYQRILKRAIEFFIIKELLYESGYTEFTLDEENMVYLSIPEVDLSEKIKREAHHLNLYLSNAITEDELRKNLGRDILNEIESGGLYINKVQIPLAAATANDTAAQNTSENISRPTNQYGTQLSKPTISKDYYRMLWDTCIKFDSMQDVQNELIGSNLEPNDITSIHLMITNHSKNIELKDATNLVFLALEDSVVNGK